MNVGRIGILSMVAAFGPSSAQAQTARASGASPLAIGETFTVDSRVLGETRRINVYAPALYIASGELRVPVLYMPDGGIGEDFLHVAGLMQVLVGNGGMRPFLLVGIENTARRRDLTGPTENAQDRTIAPVVGGSAAFRQFLRAELMPVISERYRTTGEAAIVGESLAGLFVVETFFLEPELFDTYIAFDPSLWWNDAELVARAIERMGGVARTIYLANSNEPVIAGHTQRLASMFAERAPSSIRWHYEPMPEESHATIYHPAALRAFRLMFKPDSAVERGMMPGPRTFNPNTLEVIRRAEAKTHSFDGNRNARLERLDSLQRLSLPGSGCAVYAMARPRFLLDGVPEARRTIRVNLSRANEEQISEGWGRSDAVV
jgi:hypothetical protein